MKKEVLVYGVYHSVPGKRGPDRQWVEDTRFVEVTKKQIDKVVAGGGKILFLETSKEDIRYFDELTKIANLDWKGEYKPPKELPGNLKKMLTAASKTLIQGELMSATIARRYIRRNFLTDGGRYFMDVANHARRAGLKVVPIVSHKFLEQESDLQRTIQVLRSQGRHKEAMDLFLESQMQSIEMEYFMRREIEKHIKNGILPDAIICGGIHSREIERLLKKKGVRVKRKNMPFSMFPKHEQQAFKRIKPVFAKLRGLYAEERKRQLTRLAKSINTVKEKKTKIKRNKKIKPKRTRIK